MNPPLSTRALLIANQWKQDRDCPYPALTCIGCGAAQAYAGQPGHNREGCWLQQAIDLLEVEGSGPSTPATEPRVGNVDPNLLILPEPGPDTLSKIVQARGPTVGPNLVITHEHEGQQIKWSTGRVCVWKVGIAGDSEESFALEFENKDGVVTQMLLTENGALALGVLIEQIHFGDEADGPDTAPDHLTFDEETFRELCLRVMDKGMHLRQLQLEGRGGDKSGTEVLTKWLDLVIRRKRAGLPLADTAWDSDP